jgi:hypothetical protein
MAGLQPRREMLKRSATARGFVSGRVRRTLPRAFTTGRRRGGARDNGSFDLTTLRDARGVPYINPAVFTAWQSGELRRRGMRSGAVQALQAVLRRRRS